MAIEPLQKNLARDTLSKSYFITLPNPELHGFTGEPNEIAQKLLDVWLNDDPHHIGAVSYCKAESGFLHAHAVLEDDKKNRFSHIQDLFTDSATGKCWAHIEATKGNKREAEDYIYKRGNWVEKGEVILGFAKLGEIQGRQGGRTDIEKLTDLIECGMTPDEILNDNPSTMRYEELIKKLYMQKKKRECPDFRSLKVYWHFGDSGSGKTYVYEQLREKNGDKNVYLVSDYNNGMWDFYLGQHIVCFDEFRGRDGTRLQFPYSTLLSYLQGYKQQLHCRFRNSWAMWDEVHIFSVLTPHDVYKRYFVTDDEQASEPVKQLLRRINYLVYHENFNGEYRSLYQPMTNFTTYDSLIRTARESWRCDNQIFSDFLGSDCILADTLNDFEMIPIEGGD